MLLAYLVFRQQLPTPDGFLYIYIAVPGTHEVNIIVKRFVERKKKENKERERERERAREHMERYRGSECERERERREGDGSCVPASAAVCSRSRSCLRTVRHRGCSAI